MNGIAGLFANKILGVAILSWFIAQLLKFIITLVHEHEIDFRKFISSGGMPSSHSSFVTALAIGIGQVNGYDSSYFAIAAVLSFIVMYDAANVRLQAGKQAAMINQIIKVLEDPNLNAEQRLKEILGHTPLQVAAGCILGIVIGLLAFM
nr:divergent PAP2 family protein [uncultured Cellulosilyticum sp.]